MKISKYDALKKFAIAYSRTSVPGFTVAELRTLARKRNAQLPEGKRIDTSLSAVDLAKALGVGGKEATKKKGGASAVAGAAKKVVDAKKGKGGAGSGAADKTTQAADVAPKKPQNLTGAQARAQLAAIEAQMKKDDVKGAARKVHDRVWAETKKILYEKGEEAADAYYSEQSSRVQKAASDYEKGVLQLAREVLYVPNPSKMKASDAGSYDPYSRQTTGKPMSAKQRQTCDRGIQEFKKMVGVPTLDNKTLAVAAIDDPSGMKDRSFYGGKSNRVHMASKADEAVVIHEAAHWLQEQDPQISAKIDAFIEKRTKGEQWQKLSDLTGNPNYGDNEVAKPDKWMRPYMGKKTAPGQSEILSMGLEFMYRDPIGFAKKDPEYFDFVYDLMRGK